RTSAYPTRWVNESLRARLANAALAAARMSQSRVTSTSRNEVAVGRPRLASIFWRSRSAGPLIGAAVPPTGGGGGAGVGGRGGGGGVVVEAPLRVGLGREALPALRSPPRSRSGRAHLRHSRKTHAIPPEPMPGFGRSPRRGAGRSPN